MFMAVRFELPGVVPDTGSIPKMTSRYYRFLTSRVPRRKERERVLSSCGLRRIQGGKTPEPHPGTMRLFVGDGRTLHFEDKSIEHDGIEPLLRDRHIGQSRPPGFCSRLPHGVFKPGILVDRNESEQHDSRVRDSRAFYLKDISVNHITPPPSFGDDHVRQPRRPGFLNGFIVGLDEPVVLLNRDESEQHQTHMITPCWSQRLLTRRNRSGRNLHVCRVTCRTADQEC